MIGAVGDTPIFVNRNGNGLYDALYAHLPPPDHVTPDQRPPYAMLVPRIAPNGSATDLVFELYDHPKVDEPSIGVPDALTNDIVYDNFVGPLFHDLISRYGRDIAVLITRGGGVWVCSIPGAMAMVLGGIVPQDPWEAKIVLSPLLLQLDRAARIFTDSTDMRVSWTGVIVGWANEFLSIVFFFAWLNYAVLTLTSALTLIPNIGSSTIALPVLGPHHAWQFFLALVVTVGEIVMVLLWRLTFGKAIGLPLLAFDIFMHVLLGAHLSDDPITRIGTVTLSLTFALGTQFAMLSTGFMAIRLRPLTLDWAPRQRKINQAHRELRRMALDQRVEAVQEAVKNRQVPPMAMEVSVGADGRVYERPIVVPQPAAPVAPQVQSGAQGGGQWGAQPRAPRQP